VALARDTGLFCRSEHNHPRGKRVVIFQDSAHRLSLREAVERGELAPIRCFRVLTNVDLSRVRFNQVQYNGKDIEETVLVPPRDRLIVDTYVKHVNGQCRKIEGRKMESGRTSDACPFCHLEPGRVLAENELAVAIADAFPVCPGHTLVIPRRHVADFFELGTAEVAAVMELLFRMQNQLAAEGRPGGFNLGVNVGRAAGQTVMHAHVHLLPRFAGDVPDPTGGVRNVLPGRGCYPSGT